MSNDNTKAMITATDVASKAVNVRKEAEDRLANISLARIEASDLATGENKAQVVRALIQQVDYEDPASVASICSWAFAKQVEGSLASLDAVQHGPDSEAVLAMRTFEKTLKDRMAPYEERMKVREALRKRKSSRFGGIKEKISTAIDYIRDPSGNRYRERKLTEYTHEVAEIKEDRNGLSQAVLATKEDVLRLHGLLLANKHRPQAIQEQLLKTSETQYETAERILLTLAAVKEVQGDMVGEVIPEIEDRIGNQTASLTDYEKLRSAKETHELAIKSETSLTNAFVSAYLTKEMARELYNINNSTGLAFESLSADALPTMLNSLQMLMLQQSTDENLLVIQSCHEMKNAAIKATVTGMDTVYKRAIEVDKQALETTAEIVRATGAAIKAADDFRQHERDHLAAQKEAQQTLRQSYAELRVASAKLQSDATTKALPGKSPSTVSVPDIVIKSEAAKKKEDKAAQKVDKSKQAVSSSVIDAIYSEAKRPARKTGRKTQPNDIK